MDWFTVDKEGLAKLLDKRGKAFALYELVQNAWDTSASRVDVTLTPVAGRPLVEVRVEDDDPDGFKTLAHAWTLFAESEKKNDPQKRGRFNLGEKLVLALCTEAAVASTTGGVRFDADGRHALRTRRERGSEFRGTMRMTREEHAEVLAALRRLLVPAGCITTLNGEPLPPREHIRGFATALPTEVADVDGFLRRSERNAHVEVFEPREGEAPTLYEMGIPVVEFSGGERWHVNVCQKVPLNADRDNVTPAYLQTLRVALANAMREHLSKDDATQVWVSAATEDKRIEPGVVEQVLDERFGEKRAVYDPSDPEANKEAMNRGYTIVPGGSLSAGQWRNVREHGLALPAGAIAPSGVRYDPNGRPERIVDPEKYTPGQRAVVDLAHRLARLLLGKPIQVKIVSEMIALPHAAWYGGGMLAFNVGRLGQDWFCESVQNRHIELLLHEFAHDRVKDHLTREFADEVARLGAKLAFAIWQGHAVLHAACDAVATEKAAS